MKNDRSRLGIFYVILSAVLFGTMPLLTRIAYVHGSNAYTVAFGRFFFGSIVLGLICLVLPGCSIKIKKEQFLALLKLSIPYALMPILLYASYTYIDSGMATTLHFTYPVAVMLILAIFFRSRPDTKQIICAILCVGGMALLYTPNGQVRVEGILLAVASGIIYAVYIVLLGKSTVKGLHSLVLAFWVSLLSAAEIGIIAFFSKKLVFSLDATGWAAEFGLALLATVFALVLFQKGVILCGEVKASLFSTFEPLTGIFIGMIAFHEALTVREGVGITGILAAVVLLAIPAKKIPVKIRHQWRILRVDKGSGPNI